MARFFYFERSTEDDLITFMALMQYEGKYMNIRLALDTGATHTVLDANIFYSRGFTLNDPYEETQVRTANGILAGKIITIPELTSFDFTKDHLPVFVFDFLSTGSAENYDGLLGLDFFENLDFRINMKEKWIQLER